MGWRKRSDSGLSPDNMFTHTLLLIDDRPAMEEDIRSALADAPIQIAVAVNGHRALDRIEADRPDVVLASTTALGVSGYGVAHYVAQRPYLSQVAVLLLTGNIGPADAHRMKESGARGFIRHPFEPGIVLARVKEVLMLSAPGPGQADVLGQLTTAFDAIDASMTSSVFGGKPGRDEIAITPDALARIVNDAVTKAIAAYEQARSHTPASARDAEIGGGPRSPIAPLSPWRTAQQRFQHEMGLDDIGFEPAQAPAPAESVAGRSVAPQLELDVFAFEEHESTRRIEASEPAAITVETPVEPPREALVHESASDFAFGVEDLPPRAVASVTQAAPPFAPPETGGPVEEAATRVTDVLEPLRAAVVSLGTSLADQASRLQSALAARARHRAEDRAADAPAAQPMPPLVLAPAPVETAPAPVETAPAPVEAAPTPVETTPAPTPSRRSLARSDATVPDDAAASVFFTFDPIPPVPPPVPREPRED